MANRDKSNGYEDVASILIESRGHDPSGVGASVVADWSRSLPPGATVLDLGCGNGVPISLALLDRGFNVYGVDASPSMVAAFRSRFPNLPVKCEAAEESDFFGRTFDAVISWGLFFLLDERTQRLLLPKIAAVLVSGGRLLFTAPAQRCSWADAMTARTSVSLGFEAYQGALEAAGLRLTGTCFDEGDNHYYLAEKP